MKLSFTHYDTTIEVTTTHDDVTLDAMLRHCEALLIAAGFGIERDTLEIVKPWGGHDEPIKHADYSAGIDGLFNLDRV